MNKFINTKQHKQFTEFCKACNRDKYIGLCYGSAGAGKTESAKHYTKFYKLEKYLSQLGGEKGYPPPKFAISSLNVYRQL